MLQPMKLNQSQLKDSQQLNFSQEIIKLIQLIMMDLEMLKVSLNFYKNIPHTLGLMSHLLKKKKQKLKKLNLKEKKNKSLKMVKMEKEK